MITESKESREQKETMQVEILELHERDHWRQREREKKGIDGRISMSVRSMRGKYLDTKKDMRVVMVMISV